MTTPTPAQADEKACVLLPCPFCGCAPNSIPQNDDCPLPGETNRYHQTIWCENCGAEGGKRRTEEDAIAAWNCRAAIRLEGEAVAWRLVDRDGDHWWGPSASKGEAEEVLAANSDLVLQPLFALPAFPAPSPSGSGSGMLRLSDMGYEQSLLEPEENGNYAAYERAKRVLTAFDRSSLLPPSPEAQAGSPAEALPAGVEARLRDAARDLIAQARRSTASYSVPPAAIAALACALDAPPPREPSDAELLRVALDEAIREIVSHNSDYRHVTEAPTLIRLRAALTPAPAQEDRAQKTVRGIIAWLRANASAENEPKARAALVEAHNAALTIRDMHLPPPLSDSKAALGDAGSNGSAPAGEER